MTAGQLLPLAALAGLGLLLAPPTAKAVPEADHVRLECSVLRLQVNDYSVRYQLKAQLAISAPSEAQLSGADLALMSIVNSAGEAVTIAPRSCQLSPRQFKAAHATLLFKAIEDTSAPFPAEPSNVPAGFLSAGGPFDILLIVRGEQFSGQVSFGAQLGMRVMQDGREISNFCLADELPCLVETEPSQFGPAYYKRQDLTNYVFQLASMEQALESQDYHPAVESPRYLFQLRIGDPDGGPTRLVDPQRYIEGYTPHLIRSEQTSTPLSFSADEFSSGDVVIIDFERTETLPPDALFSAARENFSSQTTVADRVVYAMYVEPPPTPAELGQEAAEPRAATAAGNSAD